MSVTLHPVDFEVLGQEAERRREWIEWRGRHDDEILSHLLAEAIRVWYEWLQRRPTGLAGSQPPDGPDLVDPCSKAGVGPGTAHRASRE